MFVGRCSEEMTADDLRSYFSKFGDVVDVFIPKPFRAFAFVTFSDADVAQSLCGDDHIVSGASVHISTAAPKTQNQNDRKGENQGGSYGYGPGWGGNQQNVNRQQGMSGQSQRNMGGNTGMNMGGNTGMNMGGFPINPAMMAAAQAALGQAGWGLLGMSQQGNSSSNSDNNLGSQNNNQGNYNQQPSGSPSNNTSGFLGWNGQQSGGGDNTQASWGQQNKGNAWN